MPPGAGGQAYYGQILGFDSNCPERGPLFRVPVTVIRPLAVGSAQVVPKPKKPKAAGDDSATSTDFVESVSDRATAGQSAPAPVSTDSKHSSTAVVAKGNPTAPVGAAASTIDKSNAGGAALKKSAFSYSYQNQPFSAGTIVRKFVAVPEGATYADITIRGHNIDTFRNVVLHTLHLTSQLTFRDTECEHFFQLINQHTELISINVEPNSTLELCMAQYWNALGDPILIDLECVFHGVALDGGECFVGGESAHRLDVYSPLRTESVNVRAKLDTLRTTLKPAGGATIIPLFAQSNCGRDMLWEGRGISAVTLTYEFELKDGAKVTPSLPLGNDALYDSQLESQLV